MEITATAFRKDLFRLLDRALEGEAVEITYKGSRLRVAPPVGHSKLARAVRRHALLVDPETIVESDEDLLADFQTIWQKSDKGL